MRNSRSFLGKNRGDDGGGGINSSKGKVDMNEENPRDKKKAIQCPQCQGYDHIQFKCDNSRVIESIFIIFLIFLF